MILSCLAFVSIAARVTSRLRSPRTTSNRAPIPDASGTKKSAPSLVKKRNDTLLRPSRKTLPHSKNQRPRPRKANQTGTLGIPKKKTLQPRFLLLLSLFKSSPASSSFYSVPTNLINTMYTYLYISFEGISALTSFLFFVNRIGLYIIYYIHGMLFIHRKRLLILL